MVVDVKLPEGAKVDQKVFDEFKGIFADPKLTPSQRAQAVVDLQTRQGHAQEKVFAEAIKAAAEKDLEALKKDPDFGGHRYEKSVETAKSAARRFFGEDLLKLLTPYGLQNNPGLLKGLARIGEMISEDSIAGTVQTGPAGDPKAQWLGKFYDHPTSQQALKEKR